jgi:hypothetical protein
LDSLDHPGFGIIFFLPEDAKDNTVSGYSLIDKHGHPIQTNQSPAAESNIRNFNLRLQTFFYFHSSPF